MALGTGYGWSVRETQYLNEVTAQQVRAYGSMEFLIGG